MEYIEKCLSNCFFDKPILFADFTEALEVLKNKKNNETEYKTDVKLITFEQNYKHTALLSRRSGLFKTTYSKERLNKFNNEYFKPLHKSLQCHISIN